MAHCHFVRPLRSTATSLSLTAVLLCGIGCGDASESADSSETGDLSSNALSDGKTYTLWIHGLQGSASTVGTYDNFGAFGPNDVDVGINKKAVNWGGAGHISATNAVVRNALDCFCTGVNFCEIAVHSAGDMQIGYALDLYGSSPRDVTTGEPGSDGKCEGSGETQVGWNIKFVDVAAGASGGSELADVGAWASPISRDLISDLRTATARTLYDHNNTQGVTFYNFAGSGWAFGLSTILPGNDDNAVAYHSSGGLSDVGSYCNPGGAGSCDGVLNLGDEASVKKGRQIPKWANHYLRFRDDRQQYSHEARKKWQGVVSVVVEDLRARED